MSDIKVDKEVPLPKGQISWPFLSMQVGESFTFPVSKRTNLQSYASAMKRKYGLEFTISKISDTECRCWRRK